MTADQMTATLALWGWQQRHDVFYMDDPGGNRYFTTDWAGEVFRALNSGSMLGFPLSKPLTDEAIATIFANVVKWRNERGLISAIKPDAGDSQPAPRRDEGNLGPMGLGAFVRHLQEEAE